METGADVRAAHPRRIHRMHVGFLRHRRSDPLFSAPARVDHRQRRTMLTRLFGLVPFRSLYEYPAQDENVYANSGMLASSSAQYVSGLRALPLSTVCVCVCVCVRVCTRARVLRRKPSFLGVSVADCLCVCWRSDMMMEVAEPFTTPWA